MTIRRKVIPLGRDRKARLVENRSNLTDRIHGRVIRKCFDNATQIAEVAAASMPPYELTAKDIEILVQNTRVLVVDDEHYMRKVIRSLLLANGVKTIYEAPDGRSGLDAIVTVNPDVVILDWEMPDINGAEFMRIVRSPLTFPMPAVPVIMLTGHVERETVVEAVRIGVNEFLCKPVSAKSLYHRLVAVRARPRAMVQIGNYYGPAPRKVAANAAHAADPTEPVWLA